MGSEDRNGIRKKRKSTRKRTPELGYYLIITDTEETEKNYFYGLHDSIPENLKRDIVIKVYKEKLIDLVEKSSSMISLVPQYSEIWIVFDRDKVINFDKIIEAAVKNGLNVGWSNPCIEIWFEAYFGTMHTYHDSVTCCKGFAQIFEQKVGQQYQKSDKDIYKKLCKYGDEKRAFKIVSDKIAECKRNGKDKSSAMCPCTTINILVEEIKVKIHKINENK